MSYWVHQGVVEEHRNNDNQHNSCHKDNNNYTNYNNKHSIYFLKEGFEQQNEQKELHYYETREEGPDMNMSGEVVNRLIEKKVLEMLGHHGGKSLHTLLELLDKKVYTVDNYLFTIHETKLAEVLKAMLVNN